MTDLPREDLEPDEVPSDADASSDPEEYEPDAPVSPETGTRYESSGQPEWTPEDDTDGAGS
jgi:hypothetical protein